MSGLPIDPVDTRFRPGVREMDRVYSELNAMGRVGVCDHLPGWFTVHAVTLDSALAAHLNANQGS
ncbi:hypothetical protein [Thiocapsa roseopersicina]|uniref:Uncharacterized protein n=1 Tax=Thiocapsa roseopersicina TaxID=1058 RepID=A0A1H2ZV43_THIRO|nr:hypothetical protein [Thiocapsa roseopersicina]SDX21225.1 hypothetical protein SAMN05421783_11752 [Thiocapsa roseopersicina]